MLKGSRCYLSGAMEAVIGNGVEWRRELTPFLQSLGVTVLDPCDKPTDIAIEDPDRWVMEREAGEYDKVSKEMRVLRRIDLKMVAVSDFLIVNLSNTIRTCGTYEELFLANWLNMPIIIRHSQGKKACSLWLFGTVPHEMIFDTWGGVKRYLELVDNGKTDHHNRWLLFNFDGR